MQVGLTPTNPAGSVGIKRDLAPALDVDNSGVIPPDRVTGTFSGSLRIGDSRSASLFYGRHLLTLTANHTRSEGCPATYPRSSREAEAVRHG